MPPQVTNPLTQTYPHVVPLQACIAFAGREHGHPLAPLSQLKYPLEHATPHSLFAHVGVVLGNVGHTVVQLPQWFGSVLKS